MSPDQKECVVCGKTFKRHHTTSAKAFSARTMCGDCKNKQHETETKTCVICGAVFCRRTGEPRQSFAQRRACSKVCSKQLVGANRRPRGYKQGGKRKREHLLSRLLSPKCDCGNPTVTVVWVTQLDGEGKETRQYIEVCADCRDLFLETDKGASLEMPPPAPLTRLQPHRDREYHYSGHWFKSGRQEQW